MSDIAEVESTDEIVDITLTVEPEGVVPLQPVSEPNSSAFRIQIEMQPRLLYAMAHNHMRFVRRLAVAVLEPGLVGPLTISVSSRWAAADLPPVRAHQTVAQLVPVGDTIEISGENFELDNVAVAFLEEAAPATLVVTVTDAAGHSQEQLFDFEVMARNQWLHTGGAISAAFVQPNHPAVSEVLKSASEILQRRTQDGSLQGYQHGVTRVHEIASAVYEALQLRVHHYVNPPASFERDGQKLRPLDEVLEQQQGTCIDLACAYASCLEGAGLYPVLFVLHGHAFAGYITKGEPLARIVIDSFGAIATEVDRGMVVPVETVGLTSTVSFDDAQIAARGRLVEQTMDCRECAPGRSHVRELVDIYQAQARGVRPLPARVQRGNIVEIVIDNGPDTPPVRERRDAATHKLLPDSVPVVVQQWKNQLLDLSLRNPLLNFKAAKTGISIHVPDGALGDIEDVLANGDAIKIEGGGELLPLLAHLSDRDVRLLLLGTDAAPRQQMAQAWKRDHALLGLTLGAELITRAKQIQSKAKRFTQETAVNGLYLTLGSVLHARTAGSGRGRSAQGVRDDGAEAVEESGRFSAPVFLVPVRMTLRRGAAPVLEMDPDGMTTVNYCLLEYLRLQHNMDLNWFRSDMTDDSGLDILAGLKSMRDEIANRGLGDALLVNDDAGLGLLQFNKVRLWKDLDEHWQSFAVNPVVKHLIETPGLKFKDPANPDDRGAPVFDDTTLWNPQPADSAQTRAIVRALAGHSFILEGPPGTGKSQTITNLLAAALTSRKRILFVAEKPQALGVVKERLQAVGLDPFCLDLHDKGSRPEQIKSQLRDSMDIAPTAALERWNRMEQDFAAVTAALERYRAKLHDATGSSHSFYSAYLELLELGEGPTAPIGRALASLTSERVDQVLDLLRRVEDFTSAALPRAGHPWSLTDTREFERIDRSLLSACIRELQTALAMVDAEDSAWGDVVRSAESAADLELVASALELAVRGALRPSMPWHDISRADWAEAAERALADATRAHAELHGLGGNLDASVLLRDLDGQALRLQEACTSFFLGRKGRIQLALGDLAGRGAFASQKPNELLSAFQRLQDAALALRNAKSRLSSLPAVAGTLLEDVSTADQAEKLRAAIAGIRRVSDAIAEGRPEALGIRAALETGAIPAPRLLEGVTRALGSFEELKRMLGSTDESVNAWASGRSTMQAIRVSMPEWLSAVDDGAFVHVRRWIDLLGHLSPLEGELLSPMRAALLSGSLPGGEATRAFERALFKAILTTVGEEMQFDVFDQAAHDRRVREFAEMIERRQEMLRVVIPKTLFDQRTFDARQGGGAVASLRSELTARRRGARSVRDLIEKYPDLIAELTPCFMMSGDSVAKFLTPGKLKFDLVVFDEASQIRVADAIGAMGRASSVVIVGDSKQMPPTSVGIARTGIDDEDDDENSAPPAESILDEAVESRIDREMLEWHYRSRDESLISFSNSQWYESRLSSFPSPQLHRPGVGLEYHRVDGQFEHGAKKKVNVIEAEAIAKEVQRRLHDPVEKQHSIGVVTLSVQQRGAVEDALRALSDQVVNDRLESEDPEDEVFVLALEHVQGRERDVIILGTSYSKRREAGKPKSDWILPKTFGPLILKGGHRRLNVAITRARRLMVVFSSFDPEDLKDAQSEGLKALKAYLETVKGVAQDQTSALPAKQREQDAYLDEVVAGLSERGFIVQRNFGLSNFKLDAVVTTVDRPNEWLVGILLDNRPWNERQLVLDRDALPVTFLRRSMNWPAIARVWLPAWRRDREEVLAAIAEQVDLAARNEVADPLDDVQFSNDDVQTSEPPSQLPPVEPALLPNVRPFKPWRVRVVGNMDMLAAVPALAKESIQAIVEAQGPMPVDDALKLLANAFGLERVREARLRELRPHMPPGQVAKTPFGDFVFPRAVIARGVVDPSFGWYRQTKSSERSITSIAPQELANLMCDIARKSHSISSRDLATAVLTFLGYGRQTADTVAHVEKVVAWAVTQRYLVPVDGLLRANEDRQ